MAKREREREKERKDMMIKYTTTFEATRNAIETVELGHGENADLHASITDEGVPVELAGYSVQAIYQPESLWGTDTFYSCPAEIAGNEAVVHWSHAQDTGDKAVKIWVRLEKDGKVSYPAMYAMALFQTPGFTPGTVDPIPPVIDFSEYTLLNAPWVTWGDYNPTIEGLRAQLLTKLDADDVVAPSTAAAAGQAADAHETGDALNALNNAIAQCLTEQDLGNLGDVDITTGGTVTAGAVYIQGDAAATEAYVDGIVGDINSALDAINGEVI